MIRQFIYVAVGGEAPAKAYLMSPAHREVEERSRTQQPEAMSPHDGDRRSSARPIGGGGPDVLEMVGTRRQARERGRSLDDRVGNSQRLLVKRHLLVAPNQLAWRGPVQRGKLVSFPHHEPRRLPAFRGTVSDHFADGGHADNPFALSLGHENRSDQTLVEAGCPAGSRE